MNTDVIYSRDEIDSKYKWATEDIYVDIDAFMKDFDLMKDRINHISEFKKTAVTSAKDMLCYYNFYADNIPVWDKLLHYSMLCSDQDTAVSAFQDLRNKVTSLYVEYISATSFFAPQLMSLSEDTLETYYSEEPGLLFYKKAIDDCRRFNEHTLDEQGEQIVAMAGEMMQAPDNVFSLLSNADLTFEPVVYDGKEYPLTHGSYTSLMENPNREIRKAAFKSNYKTYGQFRNTFAGLLYSQVKALSFNSKVRNYNSSLEAAVFQTNVSPTVYKNLIEAVHENMHYMHDYVSLRKKILGLSELHMYDIYAPLSGSATKKIPFEAAKTDVLNAMSVFGDEYINDLKKGFESRWIDIYENKGKRSGAYSAGALVHPFVLLNYKDTYDSEFTLAHEMGHAMHSFLSNTHQEPIYANYEIFVAEVASTCNEALLMQYLLKKVTDTTERIALINYFLDQFKGTLYRQTMFAEFELRINELVANGESLTADLLCEEYIKLNKEYFGNDMISDEEIALEWARIPHFYYNFYVYQYATGFSAAIALSTKILNEGQPAIDRYLHFLSSGCTMDPVSLLKEAGVDMTTSEPVTTALKLFGDLIKEMDELTSK